MSFTEFPIQLQCTPVEGNPPYSSTGSIGVQASLIPPGVAIAISQPPFTLLIDPVTAIELAALLVELVG